MPDFDPELVQIMRTALDDVMTRVPVEQASSAVKAHVAECILKAAAQGITTYDGLMRAAGDQLQSILSLLA